MRARSRARTEKSNQSAATRHRKNQKMSQQLSISAQMELKAAQDELLEISSRSKIGPAEKRRFDALLSRVSLLKSGAISDEVRAAQVDSLMSKEFGVTVERPSEEQRAKNERLEEFRHFLNTGERRTYVGMNEGTGSQGGFLVPSDFRNELFKGLAQFSDLMNPDNVRVIYSDNGRPLTIPSVDLSTLSATLIQEASQYVPANNPPVSRNILKSYFFRGDSVGISMELQQDSFEDISLLLGECFNISLARGIGSYLVTGTGSNQPQGILTAASDSTIVTAASGAMDLASLEGLYFSLNRVHRSNPKAAFIMNDTTYQLCRAVNDSAGRPLISIHKDDELLFGKKILIAPDMPTGAGSKSIVFANLSQYVVRIVRTSAEVTIARELPGYCENGIALATSGLRVDAQLVNPAASTAPVAVFLTQHS
jgi:HK97 family phage major capsid protein